MKSQDERRCQKCGSPTKGEEAYVDGQIWCHPCADEEQVTDLEGQMTNTLTTVAVLGVILFGIIPFGADWWRDLVMALEKR